MLYDKNKTERLSEELFRNPTSEYRGAPFWAWNDELDEAECVRQADIFRKMGFGGYHMHPRAGLATPYLGDKFNACVRACVEDAKEKGMLAWLYDEDRYPSGFAGGFVTKDGRFRRRGLLFTSRKREENATYSAGRQNGGARLLARYSVRLSCGKCLCYRRLAEGEKAAGKVFYAYLIVDEPTDQFNEGGYVDALCKEALDAFADCTYGAYQANVGEEFGKTIPAIFTDEPQMKFFSSFKRNHGAKEAWIPWTDDFAETYKASFGTDVLDVLPDLFFEGSSPTLSRTRYAYHTHRTERFARAFTDNLGARAASLGISLTGHMMEEPTLDSQSRAVGETMRHYKRFGIPGIDMLCGRHEYTAAKQTESVVRQEGKEAMLKLLSEADIFVTNVRMKGLNKMGLGYEDLKDKFPGLIYAHFGVYGPKGPLKDDPGFDSTVFWWRSGMIADWMTEDADFPFKPTYAFGDTVTASDIIAYEGGKGIVAGIYNNANYKAQGIKHVGGSHYVHVELRKGRHTSSNPYRNAKLESDCPYEYMRQALNIQPSGRQAVTQEAVDEAQRMREEAEARAKEEAEAEAAAKAAAEATPEPVITIVEETEAPEGYGFAENPAEETEPEVSAEPEITPEPTPIPEATLPPEA